MNLSALAIGKPAKIVGYAQPSSDEERATITAMMEMGLTLGATVEVLHTGPFGRDPLAVSCRGALIGLGRREAAMVVVAQDTECLHSTAHRNPPP